MSYKKRTNVPDQEGKENNTLLYWFSAEKNLNESDMLDHELNRILREYNAVLKINARCLIVEQNNTYLVLDEAQTKYSEYCLVEVHINGDLILELCYRTPETNTDLDKNICRIKIINNSNKELWAAITEWAEDYYKQRGIIVAFNINCQLNKLYDGIIRYELKKDGF